MDSVQVLEWLDYFNRHVDIHTDIKRRRACAGHVIWIITTIWQSYVTFKNNIIITGDSKRSDYNENVKRGENARQKVFEWYV